MGKRKEGTHLLSDQILICLRERPQSHPELACMLKRTIGCIQTTNSMNRAMSFIEPIGNPMNRAAGPIRWRLTPEGREHLEELFA